MMLGSRILVQVLAVAVCALGFQQVSTMSLIVYLLRFLHCSMTGAGDMTWILAAENQDCKSACEDVGQFCHELKLQEVDTSREILEAAKAAGHPCENAVGWAYQHLPGVCTNPKCCGNGACTGWCAYGKGKTRTCTGSLGHYSRLCPCGATIETTTTRTTTTFTIRPPKNKRPGFSRSLFMLEESTDPLLLLAAIPAASKAADGEPAILVMPDKSDIAVQDFVEQYQPETTYLLGSPFLGDTAGKLGIEVSISSSTASACATSFEIARKLWTSSPHLIVAKCDVNAYADALIAAPLAAHYAAPLLF
eukprot:7467331-Karenia_brevis.AAC.1